MWRISGNLFIPVCIFFSATTVAQELYIQNEPASSVPKGVFGVRAFTQRYKEVRTTRSLHALRVMYGVTPRLSVMATASFSNHHDRKLPKDLLNHTHSGNQTNYYTQAIKRGVEYPYLFNGVHVFAKCRFLSIDEKYKHLRVAAYGEWSNINVAHDEAEPNLMEDTGGYGAGLITTFLKNRFAVSLTTGVIKSNSYFETQPDFQHGVDLPTKIYYGDAVTYNLSFGYRLAPSHYLDYDQPNWNLYVEFIGRSYEGARVIQNGVEITARTVALTNGSYIEVHPGIQRIVKSNLRIELSAGLNLISKSYARFNPTWTLALQRYFYRVNSK
jgi:hypothetical protein